MKTLSELCYDNPNLAWELADVLYEHFNNNNGLSKIVELLGSSPSWQEEGVDRWLVIPGRESLRNSISALIQLEDRETAVSPARCHHTGVTRCGNDPTHRIDFKLLDGMVCSEYRCDEHFVEESTVMTSPMLAVRVDGGEWK